LRAGEKNAAGVGSEVIGQLILRMRQCRGRRHRLNLSHVSSGSVFLCFCTSSLGALAEFLFACFAWIEQNAQ
jgi:hypothetical protein